MLASGLDSLFRLLLTLPSDAQALVPKVGGASYLPSLPSPRGRCSNQGHHKVGQRCSASAYLPGPLGTGPSNRGERESHRSEPAWPQEMIAHALNYWRHLITKADQHALSRLSADIIWVFLLSCSVAVCHPMDRCLPGSSVHSPGRKAAVDCQALLQVIFPTQGSSPALQVDSLPAGPPGKPKNIGVGSLSLLQGIFPTEELNRGLLHCRWIFTTWATRETPGLTGQFWKVNGDDTWRVPARSMI